MPRYLDPKADIVFKRIFGEHPLLLRHFLNAILPLSPGEEIVELEYLPAEHVPQIPTFKNSIVDVKCKDAKGRIFIVEMQMEWTLGFMQRLLFNAANAYVRQLHVKEDYKSLCPVYGIGLVNETFEKDTLEWYHHYKIVNVQNPKLVLSGLQLIFLELPKFKPSNRKEKRLQVLWIRFLSEIGEKTKKVDQELLTVPEIEKACALCEEAAYSEAELETYSKYWDAVRTAKTLQRGKWEEGRAEGLAEGLAVGRAKGRAEGRAEGLLEGEAKARIEVVKQLASYGFQKERIAAVVQITPAEVEEILETFFTHSNERPK